MTHSNANPESTEYRKGFDQAESAPLEIIIRYPDPANDFQRGWNASITGRERLAVECPHCHSKIFGSSSNIDSGLRKHIEYCEFSPADTQDESI